MKDTALFRVHYSITSLQGVQKHQEDVEATSPDAAASAIVERLKPRVVAVSKVKLVRDAA